MKKYLFLFLIIIILDVFFPYKIFAQGVPALQISPSSFDWGKIPYQPPSKYTVLLKNIGSSDLEIKEIFTSCHCTTAKVILPNREESPSFGMHSFSKWKGVLKPNEEAKLEITLDPKAHNVVGKTQRTIYIKTNDPQKPEAEVNFTAEIINQGTKKGEGPLEFKASAGFWAMLPVVFLGALGDSINPCAIVTLLLFVIFMFALKRPRREIVLLSLLYILGIFIIYYLIGLGLLKAFHLFNTPHLVAKAMSILAFLLGLATLYEFVFKKRLKFFTIPPKVRLKFMDWAKKASPAGSLGLGLLVGACEFPCTGGIYLAITGLLAAKSTLFAGIYWLLFYNIIFVLPLAAILVFAANPLVADKILNYEEQKSQNSRLIVGLVMIVLAILIWLWVS